MSQFEARPLGELSQSCLLGEGFREGGFFLSFLGQRPGVFHKGFTLACGSDKSRSWI